DGSRRRRGARAPQGPRGHRDISGASRDVRAERPVASDRWAPISGPTLREGALVRFPLASQLRGDPLALGRAARSKRSQELRPRIAEADRVFRSICPYCAVGCGQLVYVKDDEVIQIEGDPDSPISRGRLCPKGSASLSLVTN